MTGRSWLLVLLVAACGPSRPPLDEGAAIAAMEQRALVRLAGLALDDPADLRPQARQVLAGLQRHNSWYLPPRSGGDHLTALPPSIRVWRRSQGGSESCSGQVDVIPLEDYVKGVLPHEWISSWKDESLRAGSVAIRTYAVAWILKGGKYTCADLCDTTYSQVYKDSTLPVTDQAVDATAGQVLVKSGTIVFAEYSAENGDPTKTGVSDPVCAGKTLYGHGRGMCQWGSQRWAQQGKDYRWISLHYYPGSTLWSSGGTQTDSAPPPSADASPPPPAPDSGPPDVQLAADSHLPGADGLPPPAASPPPPGTLTGGCALAGPAAGGAPWWLVLFAVALLVRRQAYRR